MAANIRELRHGPPRYLEAPLAVREAVLAARAGAIPWGAVGRRMAHIAPVMVPAGESWSRWVHEVTNLRKLVAVRDSAGVLAWFGVHFPGCLEMVPNEHRLHLVDGVFDAAGRLTL